MTFVDRRTWCIPSWRVVYARTGAVVQEMIHESVQGHTYFSDAFSAYRTALYWPADEDFTDMVAPTGLDKNKVTVAAGDYPVLARVGMDIPNDIYANKSGQINDIDGTDVVFFKSVLTEAGDLSASTLYAAKVTQQDDGSLAMDWIELGTGTDDDVAEAIAEIELPE